MRRNSSACRNRCTRGPKPTPTTRCRNCKTTIKQGKYHLRKPTEVTCATSPVCEKHHLHRLRKTCATRWLRNGVNLMDIKTWLGHKSLETTELYLSDTKHIGSEMQANIDKAGTY